MLVSNLEGLLSWTPLGNLGELAARERTGEDVKFDPILDDSVLLYTHRSS